MHWTTDGWWFLGMHAFWWLFWVLLIVAVFAWARPLADRRRGGSETPLQVLQRRYAAGEIQRETYEQMKADLERDERATPRGP